MLAFLTYCFIDVHDHASNLCDGEPVRAVFSSFKGGLVIKHEKEMGCFADGSFSADGWSFLCCLG